MTKKIAKKKLMNAYEKDLTFMAMEYAIDRSSISCSNIPIDMIQNVYERMRPNVQITFSGHIHKRIASILSRTKKEFRFEMSDIIDEHGVDFGIEYRPFDKFLEWLEDNNIVYEEDLNLWKTIIYQGNGKYTALQYDKPREYTHIEFDKLLYWNRLAKVLNYFNHKFCIVYDGEGERLVEYIDDWTRKSYKTIEFCPVKVDVNELVENPHIIPIVTCIVKDNLNCMEVYDWCESHNIPIPIAAKEFI